jgi:N-methylhydantoinase A
MNARAARELPSARRRMAADLRYRGQSFELTVDADGDAADLIETFHRSHEARYGYRMDDEPVEVVSLRLAAFVGGAVPELRDEASTRESAIGTRRGWFDGDWRVVPVHDRRLMGPGSRVSGPTIVDFPEATCVVRPAWTGAVDEAGNLVLGRG